MTHCRLFYIILLLLFSSARSYGQQKEFIFKNFTQEEGLPSNEVYFVFEDSKHYVWIASELGVVRFNGNKFEQFNLPDNVVFKIEEDSKGRIWFFSHKALLAYFENEKIYRYQYNDLIAKRIARIIIVDAFVDNAENIILNSSLDSNYIINANGKISAYNTVFYDLAKNQVKIDYKNSSRCLTQKIKMNSDFVDSLFIFLNHKNSTSKFEIPVHNIIADHYGAIASNDGSTYFYFGKILVRLKPDGTYTMKIMPFGVLTLHFFKDDLWVGMRNGGVVLLTHDLACNNRDPVLPGKSVTSITHDFEQGLWLSTLENGVYYIKNYNIKYLNKNDSAAEHVVSHLLNLGDSMLIYSTQNGLYKLDNKTSLPLLAFKNININAFAVENKNLFIWGGTEKEQEIIPSKDPLFNYFHITKSPGESFLLDSGKILHCTPLRCETYVSGFRTKNQKKWSLNADICVHIKYLLARQAKLFHDQKNRVWAGTMEGLYLADPSLDTLIKFNQSDALLKNGVTCIRDFDNGMLAVGIRFNGLAIMNDTNIIANITENEGLLSNVVKYLLIVKNQLWAATAKGISIINIASFSPLKYTITNIGKNDGFYNMTVNQLIQYQQNVVAATNNGIYFIEKTDSLINRNPLPIPFYIKSLNISDRDSSGTNSIKLSYSQKRVLIKFNAISFNSADEIKYLYRFDNADTSWHTTFNTELLLENLAPGDYTLQIKATIPNQQRVSETKYFSIFVNKPWWQKNWFRLFAFALVFGGFYAFFSYRIRKIIAAEKSKTELNTKIAELEQTALRSQMNPHFIFNCLTSIQQLIVSGNKADANEYLVKFARLIRKTLELSAQPYVSIEEEMDYLNKYIFLEQFRLEGKFDYTVSADDNISIDSILIPNMMIQPIVENSIRHGIKSLDNRRGLITIYFKQEDNYIICTITDNGVGRKATNALKQNSFTEHKSFGIDITQKRLKTFEASDLQGIGMTVNDLFDETGAPAGTQVALQLPFKKLTDTRL